MKSLNKKLKQINAIIIFLFCLVSMQVYSQNDTIDYQFDTLSSNQSDLLNYPIIDAHQHIYANSNYWGGSPHETGITSPTNGNSHYLELVKIMVKNNVVLGLAGGMLHETKYYFENYPENDSLFKYGINFWNYDDLRSKVKTTQIQQAIQNKQVKHIGELFGIYWGIPFDDSCYQHIYAIADTSSLAVVIHTGIPPKSITSDHPDYGFEISSPAKLIPMLEKWRNVNFNAAHFGISNNTNYNFEDTTLYMMKKFKNFYVDISPTLWFDPDFMDIPENFINRTVNQGLENKILFGSDEMVWPGALSISIDYIKNCNDLSTIQKKKILYWNAARFLKLTDEEIKDHFKRIQIGIKRNLKAIRNFEIYPNPTNQTLNIQFTNLNIQYPVIKIHNITGQQVLTQTIHTQNYSVDVSNLSKGYYIISVSDATGNMVGSQSVVVY